MRRLLAHFGYGAMSDLSPVCAPKQTFADRSEFMGSDPSHNAFDRTPSGPQASLLAVHLIAAGFAQPEIRRHGL
jgi:hypothetical protein